MNISYKKLWKLLIDKDMTAVELREKTGIAPNTMTKLRRDEEVSLSVLVKICTVLNANIGDIMDLIPAVLLKLSRTMWVPGHGSLSVPCSWFVGNKLQPS